MGLRVSAEEEIEGLDIGEHGNSAYPDFQVASVHSGMVPGARIGGQPVLAPHARAETVST